MRVAIVTGGSAGLGVEFVRGIERRFDVDEIWMVARREEPMVKLASSLEGVVGVPVVADLATDEGVGVLIDRMERERPDLKLLVNNAGFGHIGRFSEMEDARVSQMMDLNVKSLARLTLAGLKWMNRGASIIQVASVLGFIPASGWSLYSASKAFVISFSCGLSGELRSRGIGCTVCCPGPMKTEFYDVAGEAPDIPFMLKPGAVADLALAHARRGKMISVKGIMMKLTAFFFSKILPRGLFVWATRRTLEKQAG